MAPLEFWRKESLNKQEQVAFSDVADALIFETRQHFKLSRKTVPEFSRRLQGEFSEQDKKQEDAMQGFLNDQVRKVLEGITPIIREHAAERQVDDPGQRSEPKQVEEKNESPSENKPDERSVSEKIISAANLYIIQHGREYWQSWGYGAWGFTPKLAAMRSKEYERPYQTDGKNCFGVVQGLGALFHEMGSPVRDGNHRGPSVCNRRH
jgi:hypothetical protein